MTEPIEGHDLHFDGAACPLPSDATCAAVARAMLTTAMTRLGLPEDQVSDGTLLVSELVTNSYQHQPRGQNGLILPPPTPPELWAHMRNTPEPQLVVSVFDGHRHWGEAEHDQDDLDEHGRGLPIVRMLSADMGIELTRSKLAPRPVRGKRVWFAQSLPPGWPVLRRKQLTVARAAWVLHAQLNARGIDGVIRGDQQGVSVVSVCKGLSVWVKGSGFCWEEAGHAFVHRSLYDLADTIELVVRRHEELDAMAGEQKPSPC